MSLTRYAEIVTAIGPGFHPDTDPETYVNLPPEVTPQDISDALIDLPAAVDASALALAVLALGENEVIPCPEHPDAGAIVVETGYHRVWRCDPSDPLYFTDDRIDWESGAGDDEVQCARCLTPLIHSIDFAEVSYS